MKFPQIKSHDRRWLIIPAAITLVLCFVFYYNSDTTDRNIYRTKLLKSIQNDTEFSSLINDLFCYEVSSNSVTEAYTVRKPSDYNIPKLNPILTDFSNKDYADDDKKHISQKTIKTINNSLKNISPKTLSENDRITYDLLSKHLDLSDSLCDYSYYDTLLGKTTGAAATLPITLSEFPLNNKSDIETYFEITGQIPAYFDDVIEYEKVRVKQGMATPDFLLRETESEMEAFIKSLSYDDNCFVTTFNDRIRTITDINSSEQKKYMQQNKHYVNQIILPAYQKLYKYIENRIEKSNKKINKDKGKSTSKSLSKNLVELPDTSTSYGLSSYPDGSKYYELLVIDTTGSYRSINEMIDMTEQTLNNALSDVLRIATTDTDAYLYYCDHPLETGFHSPEGILEALSLMIREKYPVLSDTPSYDIKTVPKSLAASSSPAFYMIPAIDDYNNNTIYINPLYTSDYNGNLFTTLAHEGFPGHLYQTVYFNDTSPAPIRQILDYPGYVEGWATYVELDSFNYITYPKYADSLPVLYRSDSIINLALSSRIDIGVNYEGWTLEDTCRYFEELGFNSYYASDIYSYVVEAPANYLSYFIGYLEIEKLKQEYKNLKMENYTDKDFHKALLDIGPGDFETIRKYMLY